MGMTETKQESPVPGISWDKVTPTFKDRLREPAKPARPSDGAIAMAQRSYDGYTPEVAEGEKVVTQHVMSHRFKTADEAELAKDELKRAGAYTTPESTVTAFIDEGDKRIVTWRAGNKRGRH